MPEQRDKAAWEYDRAAADYARATDRPLARIRFATLRSALLEIRDGVPPDARVLDLGCGTGVSTEWARKIFPGAAITGIDISEAEIGIARQRSHAAGLDIDYRVGDLFGGDYPEGGIDLFVSVMALHYSRGRAELSGLLRRLSRAMTPAGFLVAQIANPDVPLPYRDYGIEHIPETVHSRPYAQGTPYKVRLHARPHRRFEPDWPQPLVEFTNYVQTRADYEHAFDAAGLRVREQPLAIPDEVRAECPDTDWTDLLALPLYLTLIAHRG